MSDSPGQAEAAGQPNGSWGDRAANTTEVSRWTGTLGQNLPLQGALQQLVGGIVVRRAEREMRALHVVAENWPTA